MSVTDLERWNTKYAAKSVPTVVSPDEWLVKQVAERTAGEALELACGLGHNAIWLAQQGWRVDAVDVSPVGLGLAEQLANRVECQTVSWIAADLDEFTPQIETYDLVLVFRFLDRLRLPGLIVRALHPGGLLVYETFSRAQMARDDNHLRSADFTLAPGELPLLFPELTIVDYDEIDLPDRSVARLAARKGDG
ncbi:MAG: class I SAM-dependent methyltransferase [Candidatus Saccharimonas sp.]|nr:class I SAM-dependent methyltransferase [Planctomycetaceae bacterium]